MKETLEEAAERYVKSDLKKTPLYGMFNDTFIAGAKWQQEQMKAREIESPIVKQLLDETTPEQFNKINKEMSNNKQTAVEWLATYLKGITSLNCDEVIEQAKAMEKEQIIEFADNYVDNCVIPNENMAIPTIMDVPQYYNKTYGGNNEQQ